MEWNRLEKKGNAPEQGWMLAYLRNEVLFDRYRSLDEVRETVGRGELLELHLFDRAKEYRCIASQSRRYPSGAVETVADFDENSGETYAEDVYLEEKYRKETGGKPEKKIRILNHLKYDENGMLEVDNYRLVMEVQ